MVRRRAVATADCHVKDTMSSVATMMFGGEGSAAPSSSEQVVRSTGSGVATSSRCPVLMRRVGPSGRGRRGRALQPLHAGIVPSDCRPGLSKIGIKDSGTRAPSGYALQTRFRECVMDLDHPCRCVRRHPHVHRYGIGKRR
jgi:hypothetical protein